ncbi:MAG: hypothetical protein A3K22_02985 [Deltaproteobacteria bacterium RBG_16_42_7]|nr:MAG: hypothetical protein A3K22_02985 [Deltaproteobacteria bacterium RBG_16_42_7]
MERTTIYLDDVVKQYLLELSAEESKKKKKRVGMAEMIRAALISYLKEKGKPVDDLESVKERMLSTKGKLSEDFEGRVKKVKKEFDKWKIESV